MTPANEPARRPLLIQMIRALLQEADGHQLGPALLVDRVLTTAARQGSPTRREAVQLAMYSMTKNGELFWTREGPMQLIHPPPNTPEPITTEHRPPAGEVLTSANEPARRPLLIQMIRALLQEADGHQLGPALLVDRVLTTAARQGSPTRREAVQLAMYSMTKDGELFWTREGPMRLIHPPPNTPEPITTEHRPPADEVKTSPATRTLETHDLHPNPHPPTATS